MADIISINGKVAYSITLDPSIWIFDDRKFKMEDFFAGAGQMEEKKEKEDDITRMGRLWDKELEHGSTPTKQSEQLFVEKKQISGDYGMPLVPFLRNAEPAADAIALICRTETGEEYHLPLAEAEKAILCFAIDGKPIREDGPVYLYYGDGRNMDSPIRQIISLTVV
ncbi:peptidyl-prolyl cis-trans isomerase [Aneurinibacillus uraniidurans]|uniref:peptidyl-prolyl cis-trans isomerase n=1 Tax=Aneurinibacillus uraniidurans TaxID=2966586 RepID=UPI00234A48A0|nr:peptidyl-prolyl cis-trans isomerase [Aneurinibacillus sp. B1]WCN38860.1 peptidyl-prolyl cis-trans isomerase [Aneurinibacillus sp. B1]